MNHKSREKHPVSDSRGAMRATVASEEGTVNGALDPSRSRRTGPGGARGTLEGGTPLNGQGKVP